MRIRASRVFRRFLPMALHLLVRIRQWRAPTVMVKCAPCCPTQAMSFRRELIIRCARSTIRQNASVLMRSVYRMRAESTVFGCLTKIRKVPAIRLPT
uniref:Putative secreted protein n=1 Tax=Anopheles triannulatus TaxID=58253 RepID=A0A2M4B1U9_9DIPT